VTNDETMLREVDQALAEDQTALSLQKNLPAVIGAALIIVVGVGGWQAWSHQRAAAATKASAAYDEALRLTGSDEGTKALEALAQKNDGYGAVAKMRLAGEKAAAGEREKALALYREVYGVGAASKRMKDMARLRAAYLSVDDGREAVIKDVGSLETDETELGFYAREILALAALNAKDYQSAEEMFLKAASSPEAPASVRTRAGEFAALASAGKAGVEFPAIERDNKSDAERYLEGLERAGSDLSSVVGATTDAPEATAEEDAPDAAESAVAPTDEPANPEGNE